ncbi:MAG: septum formation initiator family protein [Lachnospiraceae bacterium]|nr:septum formation initiator family protein [Lachnospiraceae bacterium]
MATKRVAYKRKSTKNLLSMFLISVIVLTLLVVVSINSAALKEKQAQYDKREAYLQARIEEQHKRAEEIEDYRKYMQTKQYVEDTAKRVHGLVYPDEIILEAIDSN